MKINIRKSIIALASIFFSSTLFFSCSYDEVLPDENVVIIELPEGEVLSFAKDIQPIFTANCLGIGCHSGSVEPDLSAGESYDELKTGSYINTGSPKNSSIYKVITTGGSMISFANATERATILKWIEDGALNN